MKLERTFVVATFLAILAGCGAAGTPEAAAVVAPVGTTHITAGETENDEVPLVGQVRYSREDAAKGDEKVAPFKGGRHAEHRRGGFSGYK